jgi:hypothetical protein
MCCTQDNTSTDKNFSLRALRDSEFKTRGNISDSMHMAHAPAKTKAAPVKTVNPISDEVKELLSNLPDLSFSESSSKTSLLNIY